MEELITSYFETMRMQRGRGDENQEETTAALDLLDKLDVETPLLTR